MSVHMTSHRVYEWQHNHCSRHHTHYICVITPTWLMISHPMSVWTHTHCMYDITGTLYDITSPLDDLIPLFLCHGSHCLSHHITMDDVTHTVCVTTQALYLTWNPFYMPSHLLYMSSHALCQRHHTNYESHHRWHMYAIMYTIHDNISNL